MFGFRLVCAKSVKIGNSDGDEDGWMMIARSCSRKRQSKVCLPLEGIIDSCDHHRTNRDHVSVTLNFKKKNVF